ncbi:ABC transporter permease [Candidatus Poribacteria bacterium]|nr:ABC transporter permease [Candidatus Poribacteria bacterium]
MVASVHRFLRGVWSIVVKELIQARRDPSMFPLIFVAPLVQLALFGYAVATNIRHIPTAIMDEDRTAQSRAFVGRFGSSGYFSLLYFADSERELEELIQSGKAEIAIRVPRGFARAAKRRESASVQMILDGSDSNTTAIALGYAVSIAREHSAEVAAEWLRGTRLQLPAIDLRARAWYNEDLDNVNFVVPGIICTILSLVTTVLTAQAVVRERERGTMEQLIVSPISRTQFIVGKLVPFMIIGYIDVFLILTVGTFWFGVPFRGSVVLLYALAFVFLLSTLGTGLLISTVANTQGQASLAANFLLTPWFLLSGFVFPIENMPTVIQWATYLIPLRYFLVVIRGIMLKGLGLVDLWQQVLPLAALGVSILGVSVMRLQKRLG